MRRKADLQLAIDLELQRRFLALKLPERENERSSLSIGSPAHLPPRFNHSLFFQPESIMEGCCCCCCWPYLSFSLLDLY